MSTMISTLCIGEDLVSPSLSSPPEVRTCADADIDTVFASVVDAGTRFIPDFHVYVISMNDIRLTCDEIEQLLASLVASNTDVAFDPRRQSICFENDEGRAVAVTLPLVLPAIYQGTPTEILAQLRKASRTYTIVLVQAGAAALGFIEQGRMARHKVIKKYMVRQKQGSAQIKHLKTRGKSRLGSRIRLKNSIAFFEEINETLTAWRVASMSETILMALPINLKNLFYTADILPPFDRKDPRIKKIPLDIRIPTFKELEHVNWEVSRGTLITDGGKRFEIARAPAFIVPSR
jgi:hypothetical protein